MKKQHFLLLPCIMFMGILSTFSQGISSDYFEVYTKLAHPRASTGFSFNRDSILSRINNIPDSAGTYATFVVSVNIASSVDSLAFTLTNSQGQVVYNGGGDLNSLQTSPSFKITGNTLYYTVGPFPYLKHFSATARIKGTDGLSTPVKSFAKN